MLIGGIHFFYLDIMHSGSRIINRHAYNALASHVAAAFPLLELTLHCIFIVAQLEIDDGVPKK